MNKIWLIIKREYITRVRKRSFLLTTLIAPLALALLMVAQILLLSYSTESTHIAVKDESGLFSGKLNSSQSLKYSFHPDDALEVLKKTYKESGYNGILYIPEQDIQQPKGIKYISENSLGIATKAQIESALEREIRKQRISRQGLSEEVLNSLDAEVIISEAGVEDKSSGGGAIVSTITGYIMGFIIYIVLFVYGTMVMKGVVEEKTNRIMEVIVSSVKPFQLMLGKILGIGAVGLTQFFLWIVLAGLCYAGLAYIFADKLMEISSIAMNPELAPTKDAAEFAMGLDGLKNINWPQLLGSFVFYFFGGYLFYAALFAALGSAVGEESDSQAMMLPITIPIILAIFLMMIIITQPHSSLAVWSSMIPFFSPIIMPARIPFGIPAWEIFLSMFFLILGFIFTTWLAAKIYRVGVLMYGKRVTFRELWKWTKM